MTESRAAQVIAIAWVFTGIAVATVALKLFARAHVVKVVGWDDFFIFFSLVSTPYLVDSTRDMTENRGERLM